MQDILIVVDMQNDFISGALGTPEAQALLPRVVERLDLARERGERVYFTRDSHEADYLDSQEGRLLPVEHCLRGSWGWQLADELLPYAAGCPVIDKPSFGSAELGRLLAEENAREPLGTIRLLGLCTDICVISNAVLLKAFLPETPIQVEGALCAGVSPESHSRALAAMGPCQIAVV